MQPWREEHAAAMTYDEVSLEQSKSFVKALQELKNLRPQLYSAAEYCEKSYLHNDQKQIVLDNLKDYAVRALVNAVDHLGTVAYKLTDLYEQNTLDLSTVELQVSCLNQRISTCQEYGGKEGLRQQQICVTVPKHHKHYILPNTMNQKTTRSQISQSQAKPLPRAQVGTSTSKTLSWHLDSESNSSANRASSATVSIGESKPFKLTSEVFHLLDAAPEETTPPFPLGAHLQSSNGSSSLQSYSVKDCLDEPKSLSTFKSFENPRRDIIRAPARNKSMLSVFFTKSKTSNSRKHVMGLK